MCPLGSTFTVNPTVKEFVFPKSTTPNMISIGTDIIPNYSIDISTGKPACDVPFSFNLFLDSAKTTPFVPDSQISLVGTTIDGKISP
jgi:hypothetical protein